MINQGGISGIQKAAILMLALSEENCASLFDQMQEEEIREISSAMSQLGTVSAETVEMVCGEFTKGIGGTETLVGNLDSTERLLKRVLSPSRAAQIMDEIRGPAGRTMWDKLGNISDAVLANYLKNEYPQTVAVILGKIKPEQAARVLAALPEDTSLDIITRMLQMDSVPKEVLRSVEQTLRSEFVSNLSRGLRRDSHEQMADIFNNLDRRIENKFMLALSDQNAPDAERIKALMFTFDDLIKLSPEALAILLSRINRELLPLALKGTTDELRDVFLAAMSERAGRMLRDDILALGPVRVKDVDAAQAEIVQVAKDLIDQGEIEISANHTDNEFIS